MVKGSGLSALGVALGVLCLVACGESTRNPGVMGSGGSGGAGSAGSSMGGKPAAAGSGSSEGGATSAGTSSEAGSSVVQGGAITGGASQGGAAMAGAPTITLHTCPETPDPPCPAKTFTGAAVGFDPGDLDELEGVTVIEGTLDIYTPEDLEKLSCLETVTDDIDVSLGIVPEDVSLWGLRNVKSVGGGISIRSGFGRIYQDCGFTNVEVLGAKYTTGGAVDVYEGAAGELDLSSLKQVRHVRVHDSDVTVVTLPSDVTLEFGQLWFVNNPLLISVFGFYNVTIELGLNPVKDTYSGLFQNNPQLPDCHARRLNQLLLDAGNDPNWVLSEGNLVCFDK